MPRAMWSGAISFGLVNIPVKLFPAVRPKDVHFNQLEASTGARIRQKRVSSVTGEEVPYDQVVKGYEISPDRYVMISPEELDALDPKATHSIDIEDFVDLDQIDPLYFERPYYLVPEAGGAKAYALLREAMHETNKVAISRLVLRTKQYLAAIRPLRAALVLETMMYADEVVDQGDLDGLPGEDIQVTDRELKIARQLIDALVSDFHPDKYKDEYRERVLALIEAKAEGQEVSVQPVAEQPAQVVDLMSALEASLDAVRGAKRKGA